MKIKKLKSYLYNLYRYLSGDHLKEGEKLIAIKTEYYFEKGKEYEIGDVKLKFGSGVVYGIIIPDFYQNTIGKINNSVTFNGVQISTIKITFPDFSIGIPDETVNYFFISKRIRDSKIENLIK